MGSDKKEEKKQDKDVSTSADTTLFQVEDLELEDTTARSFDSKGSNSLTLTQSVFKAVESRIPKTKQNPFTLITMSAGESMADIFPEWVRCSFFGPPDKRSYKPYDLNMPVVIPRRTRMEYSLDPPLTEHGKVCANTVSKGLIRNKLRINVVYTAPEMICVLTASTVITAQLCKRKVKIPIRIEPGLANYKGFRKADEESVWGRPEFYKSLGFPVDTSYEPLKFVQDLPSKETPAEYYHRITDCCSEIANANEEDCVLIVGHSANVYAAFDGSVFEDEVELMRIRKEVEPCTVEAIHFVFDGEHMRLSRPTLPFTRTLNHARELRKREKLELRKKKNEEEASEMDREKSSGKT